MCNTKPNMKTIWKIPSTACIIYPPPPRNTHEYFTQLEEHCARFTAPIADISVEWVILSLNRAAVILCVRSVDSEDCEL